MATNNQANDRYNPPGSLSVDFEEFEFGELEDVIGGRRLPIIQRINITPPIHTYFSVLFCYEVVGLLRIDVIRAAQIADLITSPTRNG